MSNPDQGRKYSTSIKWISLMVIVAGLIMTMRQLPMEQIGSALDEWLRGLGIWGPVAFAAIYVLAAVLFIPGSVLTLAGGAIFGLWVGTAAVSIGSTGGAALSFLIARFVARDSVAGMARGAPRFAAIDRAIGEGGWKIVAMLRLCPFMPFNLQNYLYGVTSIGFWPCVLASWIAMLPGTFMYVYFGHVAGLAVAGESETTMGQWILLAVGLAATVAVSVYITKLARRAISRQTDIDEADTDQQTTEEPEPAGRSFPWGTALTALIAMAVAGLSVTAHVRGESLRNAVTGLMGPPEAVLAEAYSSNSQGPRFDHTRFDGLLERHVDRDGYVDYRGLLTEMATLDAYLELLAAAPFEKLGRNQKLALLINAYNAFTLRLILDQADSGGIPESIKDIPGARRWADERWNLGGNTWSLNQIEHEQIRPKFVEPRVHFALVCAAVGCPPLRNEAYDARRLEQQLESQSRYVHTHGRWFRYDEQEKQLRLTALYNWYGGDFEQAAGSVVRFAARYAAPLEAALQRGETPRISWLDYDWRLNSRRNREPGQ